jgi:hypothetical protein
LPSAWDTGDAAAVLVTDGRDPEPERERLTAALLAEGAAILELDTAAVGVGTNLLPTLFGALTMLRRHQGSGPVVLLGWGAAADAVLAAAREDVAAVHTRAAWPRFAAAVALAPGVRGFAAGTAPPPEQDWAPRAAILCRLLSAYADEDAAGTLRSCLDELAR